MHTNCEEGSKRAEQIAIVSLYWRSKYGKKIAMNDIRFNEFIIGEALGFSNGKVIVRLTEAAKWWWDQLTEDTRKELMREYDDRIG
jgi:hypothetical protein